MGFLKGRFSSLRGLRQQIDNPKDHKRALTWIKTCVVIHTLISFVEHADEDGDFVAELMREGQDGTSETTGHEGGAVSDVQRETLGQRRRTQLKEWLFESFED
jgi:hypothetical protein